MGFMVPRPCLHLWNPRGNDSGGAQDAVVVYWVFHRVLHYGGGADMAFERTTVSDRGVSCSYSAFSAYPAVSGDMI